MKNSIAEMRMKNTNSLEKPLLNDWFIATEIILYELHKSIFHYTISIGKDALYLLDPSYPTNLNCITFNFIKYELNSASIEELIKSFNKRDSLFLYRLHGDVVDKGECLEAFVTISDKFSNVISDYRMRFSSASFNKRNFRQKWIKLPSLDEKVFLFIEEKEKVLADELEFLINSLRISEMDTLRIVYLLSCELRKNDARFYLDKLADKLKFSDRFSLIRDIEGVFLKCHNNRNLKLVMKQIDELL
ncbi:MAG: hypothetical protein WC366_00600 [Bacilli bacterium]